MVIDILKKELQISLENLGRFISDEDTWKRIEEAGEILVDSLKKGGKVLSCGNGGSMCDAMHFAEELTGRFRNNRHPLAAISLSDPSHITCVGNDYSFEHIFARPIEALGKKGDVLLAFSTSGNSENIINAIESAIKIDMKVICLTGKTGGKTAGLCDVEIRAPYSEFSDRAQEVHVMVIHSLVQYIEYGLGLSPTK